MKKNRNCSSLLFDGNDNNTDSLAYRNLCNHPPYSFEKQFIENLWKDFQIYADKQFRKEFKTQTYSRFWEMYLGCSLLKNGFVLKKNNRDKGPDLYVTKGKNLIYIEAVTPKKGSGKDKVDEPPLSKVVTVPRDNITLRILNSIEEKKEQYNNWVKNKIIDNSMPFILAINGSQIIYIRNEDDDELPLILQSISPFGSQYYTLDIKTMEIVNSGFKYKRTITKAEGSEVIKDIISQKEYSFISGFLYSNIKPLNRPNNMTDDFIFVHNPNAIHPIQIGFFKMGREYFLSENKIILNDYRVDKMDVFF